MPDQPSKDSQVWQIAAGDGARDFRDVFLEFGLAAVGPGWPGPFPPNTAVYLDKARPEVFRPRMRAFCEDPKPGDLIVLRAMHGKVPSAAAVGLVTSGYQYRQVLDDVEGWDLRHSLDVRWRTPTSGQLIPLPGLNTRGTFARSHKVTGAVASLWNEFEDHPKRDLGLPANPLTDDQLIDSLIDQGVPTGRAEVIASTVWRLRRLASWYRRAAGYRSLHGSVAEHEIRTFLIVPLLLALGWPEQRLKIEHNYVDISLFDRPFCEPNARIETIIETKRLWHALGGSAVRQATQYADKLSDCRRLVVSDGFRYKLMRRDKDSWNDVAYANLSNLRDRHPINIDVAGAAQLFVELLPDVSSQAHQ
jgi:hypothetical protein